MTDIKYSEYTKYPKIFKYVYWGNFRLRQDDDDFLDENKIFANRNKFVQEYGIIKYHPKPRIKIKEQILTELRPWSRHIEYYKCGDNRTLVIFSKYIDKSDEHNLYISKGYELIYPLYALDQKTYIKYC